MPTTIIGKSAQNADSSFPSSGDILVSGICLAQANGSTTHLGLPHDVYAYNHLGMLYRDAGHVEESGTGKPRNLPKNFFRESDL